MQEASAATSPRRPPETGLALAACALAAVTLWQRLRLDYNGPYLDESDYLYTGRLLRAGLPCQSHEFMFGSHLPLRLLGVGEALGGLHGARAVALVLGLCSLGCVFGATRALTRSSRVAAWSTALVGIAAPHMFISEFATYDCVCFCLFAASAWLLALGLARRRGGGLLCAAASAVFAVAVLSKYVVIVHAPVLALIVALRRPRYLAAALAPCALVLAEYAHRHWAELEVLFQHQVLGVHTGNSARPEILRIGATYAGPMLALALASLAVRIARAGVSARALRTHVGLVALALPLFAMHLCSADRVSMFKHMVFPAAILAPLAGWLLHRMARRAPLAPAAIVAALAGLGLYQTRQMERSFVDLEPLVAYLSPRFGPTTTVLSEDGYVFRYHLAGGSASADRHLHDLGWFDNNDDGARTPQDVIDAVWDGKPDYVMVFGQITPALTETLRAHVLPHRYTRVFARPYTLTGVMTPIDSGTLELWRRDGAYTGQHPLPL